MGLLASQVNTADPDFKQRALSYAQLLAELEQRLARASLTLDESARELAITRNKLLAEQRVQLLIDPAAPILDLCTLAGFGQYDGHQGGAGLITCLSKVAGRDVMICANNPAVKGGSYYPLTVKKHLRAQEIAEQNKLPCLYLVDSGGGYLPLQDEFFPDRQHFGRIFFNQAKLSAAGIPQLSAVFGLCTAGGAYVPAMSDETIMVKRQSSVFLGGPQLVKAATGEEVSAEELGGAEMHCRISGVADHLAENEQHAIELLRQAVYALGNDTTPRLTPEREVIPPLHSPEELYGILGTDLTKGFNMYEVLARLLDGSRFHEFKAEYGSSLLCGFAHIYGYSIGVLANNGILFSESALKGAHFIELCNQRNIPILFIQNITGFMVGKKYEQEGIAKHGAKLVSAVATSRVPKYTLIAGASYGAGNYGMCGRAYDPRFLFTWPNSKTAVMGPEQAANVLADVKRAGLMRKLKQAELSPAHLQEIEDYKQEIRRKYELEASPYYSSSRLWDDGIIDPAKTREVLALALSNTHYDPNSEYRPGVYRM